MEKKSTFPDLSRQFGKLPFMLGANYWPRKVGVQMWRKFDEAEIDEEFSQMHAMGLDVVRVFPLWDDFQPIYELPTSMNQRHTIGLRNDWNASPRLNPEMMDPEMFRKFDKVVELAGKHELKLIVALMTAWMSGVLFNPTWRGGRNCYSNTFMLKYQMLYCRAFAKRYAGRKEILAWEYGNEQNCVDTCDSPETAWVWMHALAAEMRLYSPDTFVGSGMHGLSTKPLDNWAWNIDDSADAQDFLTTHPYPAFTPGCHLDHPTGIRANMHATVESLMYSDLGKRPTLCEETGSLGKAMLSEELSGAFLKMRLYSLFANGISGCLWWCFGDFECGSTHPYRDQQMENDGLGMTRTNGDVKPTGIEMGKFRAVVEKFGGRLPAIKREAAIVVSDLVDDWQALYNCFVLCAQAGFAPKIVCPDVDDISGYKLLLLPSLQALAPMSVPAWDKVKEACADGAVIYVSGNEVHLTEMNKVFGISSMETEPLRNASDHVTFDCGFDMDMSADHRSHIITTDARVLGRHSDGAPALMEKAYGKGRAYFMTMPLERNMAAIRFANEDIAAWKLYADLKTAAGINLPVEIDNAPLCERYWNSDKAGHGWLTVINHSRQPFAGKLNFHGRKAKASVVAGQAKLKAGTLTLDALEAAIIEVWG